MSHPIVLLLTLLPALGLAQLLLPSSHSPGELLSVVSSLPGSSSPRGPCTCPGSQQPVKVVKMAKARARAKADKAHHRPQEGPDGKAAALELDQNLLGALRDVGQRLAPFKKSAKVPKKKKGVGRVRQLHHRPRREIRPATATTQGQQIVDPALAEGVQKCNSERIRHIIRKARGRDSAALKRNIQALAERALDARFNVVCARGDFSYISNTEEFCQERVNGNTCYVFRQLSRPLPFPEPPQLDEFERSFGRREESGRRKKHRRHRKKA